MTQPAPRFWLGWAFLLLVIALVGWNVRVFLRNQATFQPNEVLQRRSRNIETLAAQNTMSDVSQMFATYYRVRRLLSGKTLVAGDDHAAHEFWLERMARVVVEVVPGRLTLPDAVFDRLIPHGLTASGHLAPGRRLGIIVSDDATRYVIVSRADQTMDLLLSETRYEQERDASREPER